MTDLRSTRGPFVFTRVRGRRGLAAAGRDYGASGVIMSGLDMLA